MSRNRPAATMTDLGSGRVYISAEINPENMETMISSIRKMIYASQRRDFLRSLGVSENLAIGDQTLGSRT